jgi:hypothetical protein
MKTGIRMNMPKLLLTLPSPPKGLSFELSDLIMVLGWSEFHDLRMVVELDNYIGGEEYEEIVAFYPPDSEFRRWSMWRSKEEIVAQPTVGRAMHFTSVAGALESLIPVADAAAGLNAA